jgi:hypothetical protein
LQKCVRDLETALAHQRQLTATVEAHCRALQIAQGLVWRAVLQGRPAPEPAPVMPADPARR